MPNWCTSTLFIRGSREDINQFLDVSFGKPAIFSDNDSDINLNDIPSYFCFNAAVPVPQNVLDAGFCMVGYHWCVEHWGTKWDVYADKISRDEISWQAEGGGKFLIDIDLCTAWEPPFQWIKTVAALFPELSFELFYLDDDEDDYMTITSF